MHRTLATALVTGTVAAALAAAPPAMAQGGGHYGDDHHGHHDHGSRSGLALTDEARDTLDAYDVDVRLLGDRGDRGDQGQRGHFRGGDHGPGRSVGIAFVGDDTTVTWKSIDLDTDSGTVTALVGGTRTAVLTVETDDQRRSRHDDDHGYADLELTAAGADSIDAAAGEDAFDAGDDFAVVGDRGDCRR